MLLSPLLALLATPSPPPFAFECAAHVVIPDGIDAIPESAYQDCDVLTTSWFTTSEMWIGGNHAPGNHAMQSLNMRLTQLRLTAS